MCGDQDLTGNSFDKKISSFKLICKNFSLIVYDLVFLGNFEAFDNDMTFVGEDFNHEIRSIQIRPWKYDGHKDRKGVLPPDTILFIARFLLMGKIISLVNPSKMQTITVGVKLFEDLLLISVIWTMIHLQSIVWSLARFLLMGKIISLVNPSCFRILSYYNDKTSSIWLDCKKCYVEVYQDKHYKGRHATYITSQSFVG